MEVAVAKMTVGLEVGSSAVRIASVAKGRSGAALQQIKDKGYAGKYKVRGEPIHLIGVEFSKASRSMVGFEIESL